MRDKDIMKKDNSKRKLVIIGIDGGTFRIIDPLIEKGALPNLAKLIKSGVKGILKSTFPPITAAAWVSFMTGKNPGNHGFFDFREYNPEEYDIVDNPHITYSVKENISTLHSSRFQGQTIWDFLSNAGYEINVVAFPMTYPAWKINGRMVSGYPSPDYSKPNTYPPEWGEEIGQIFNMSAVNYSRIDGFIQECKDLVKRKRNIIMEQMRNGRGEVFSVVFSSSDFAQHYFWKFLHEKNHQYSSVIQEIYGEIDNVIGEILNLVEENTSIVVISDHGFKSYPNKRFHLNTWLAKEGYIGLKQDQQHSGNDIFFKTLNKLLELLGQFRYKTNWVDIIFSKMPLFIQRWASQQYFKTNLIDWENTRAYRFKMYGPIEGVVINQKGRQKSGIIAQGEEYENLRREIMAKLLKVKDPDTGDSVIDKVFCREDIYHGNFLKNAPDIIIQYSSNYFGGLEVTGHVITSVTIGTTSESGIHDLDGILVLCGPNFKKGVAINPVNIFDVAPTILYDLNLSIPDDIDGRVVTEAFWDSYKVNLPKYISADRGDARRQEGLTEEEEESMKKALKNLGYL
jgi:predicted AlkP superfamily phosphohydrolase/phosphomutase